jgi:hypothetical protein
MKYGHVLDHAEHRHIHRLEHLHGATDVGQRNFLRRRHQNRALHRDELS